MSVERPQWQAYLLLSPALGVIGILFGGGLILAGLQSVGLIGLGGNGSVGWAAYQQVLSDPEFLRSLGLSLYLAVVGTGVAVVASVGLALWVQGAAAWIRFGLQVTLPIPHLVGVVGILMLLSPSGLISRILFQLGWIRSDQEFPLLVNDAGNWGVLTLLGWKEIPFATLILLAVLKGIGPDYALQARVLGASAWQTFWQVMLPLMWPGIRTASVLIFGFILGSFEVPLLLGATYPRTLPVQIYRLFTDVDLGQRQEAIALGILLAVLSSGIVVAFLGIGRRVRA